MNNKKALENIISLSFYKNSTTYKVWCEIIKQDLDRLEQLEKENQELLINKNVAQGIAIKLKEENDKLKQALDKACELLADYTGSCPFSQKLMFETNCELNCKDTYKECWKKYFMKEV